MKVIEVLSSSKTSWEDATQNAVSQASKTVKNIKSVYVAEQSAVVDGDKVTSYFYSYEYIQTIFIVTHTNTILELQKPE